MVAHLFSFMISSCLARMVRTDEEDQALVAGGVEDDGVPCHFVDATLLVLNKFRTTLKQYTIRPESG